MKKLKCFLVCITIMFFSIISANAETCRFGDEKLYFDCTTGEGGKGTCTIAGPNSIHETGGEHNYHFDERIDVKLDNNVIVACEGMYFNAYDDSISGLYGENDENNIRIYVPKYSYTPTVTEVTTCFYENNFMTITCKVTRSGVKCTGNNRNYFYDLKQTKYNLSPNDFSKNPGNKIKCLPELKYNSALNKEYTIILNVSTVGASSINLKGEKQENITSEDPTPPPPEDSNDKNGNLNVDLDIDFGDESCVSYLGNPKDKDKKPPAYYLQFIFNLIKYAAILVLFAMTGVEFGKALASSNQDAMKKALQNTIKRLIIAVIIFLLPILVEFILTLLGIYSPSTCGIG